MKSVTRRIVVGVVLVVGLVGLTFVHAKTGSMCKVADRWATARLAAGTLPSTLPELSRVNLSYRRAAFGHLPVAQRRALWREQVTAFARSRTLTPAQAAFIQEDLALIDRAYDTKMSRDDYNAFVAKFLTAFRDGKQLIEFRRLGGPDVTMSPVRTALLRISPELGAANCECSTYGGELFIDDCPNDGNQWYCRSDGCSTGGWGCGFQWLQQCDGACYSGCCNGLTGATPGQRAPAAPAR